MNSHSSNLSHWPYYHILRPKSTGVFSQDSRQMKPYPNLLPSVSATLPRHFPPPLPSHNLSRAETSQQTPHLLPQIGSPQESSSLLNLLLVGVSLKPLWQNTQNGNRKKKCHRGLWTEHNPGSPLSSNQVEPAPLLALPVP